MKEYDSHEEIQNQPPLYLYTTSIYIRIDVTTTILTTPLTVTVILLTVILLFFQHNEAEIDKLNAIRFRGFSWVNMHART